MTRTVDLFADAASRLFSDLWDSRSGSAGPRQLADLWRTMQELGLMHAALPERMGGSGVLKSEAAILARIAAARNVPLPVGETMAAGWMLGKLERQVPDVRLTLALRGDLVLERGGSDGARVSGQLYNVPWGGDAELVVTTAKLDSRTFVLLCRPPFVVIHRRSNHAGEPRASLRFENAPIQADDVIELTCEPEGEDPLLYLAALRSTQMVGAMQTAMEAALDYASTRVQFGRPIGSFQAIQHILAEAAGHVGAALAATNMALRYLDEDEPRLRLLAVAAAKSRCGKAATRVAAVTHQVLGAMGFTREHHLQLSTRRLWAWREEAGDEVFWNQRLGTLAVELGPKQTWNLIASLGHGSGALSS